MKTMYLGEVVRQERKKLGVPQEMVCEGLCTVMTLSRFESGRQTPSRDCVVAILQRLGLPDDRYYAQLTRRETRLLRLRKEARAYCSQFERTLGEEQQQARMNGLKKLHDLERIIKEDDRINQQFILRIKCSLGAYSPQNQLDVLMKAIHLTSPRFDLDNLDRCLYCVDEVVLINKIAIRHSLCGQPRKAIDIYGQLLKLVLKRNPNHIYLHLIAYNYAWCLASEKRFEEALEISEFGRHICIRQGYYNTFPGFLHIEAECYYFMGAISKSLELYRSAFHIYGAIMNTQDQEALKTDAKERFKLIL